MHSQLTQSLALFGLALAEAASAGSITVVNATRKVRRDDAGLPVATHVGLEAARNEFEAFQIGRRVR
jgi:hypothetical protein